MAPATPVDAPVAPAVSPTEEQVAGAMIGDVPIEEVDAVVNAPANEGNAPAAADASAGISPDAPAGDARGRAGCWWPCG